MREIRGIGDRNAPHFQIDVFIANLPIFLIVLDALGLQLPERRGIRIFLAKLAGRIDGAFHGRCVTIPADGIVRRKPAIVQQQDANSINHAVF